MALNQHSGPSTLSTGAIIGIVGAVIVMVVIIACIVSFAVKWARRRRREAHRARSRQFLDPTFDVRDLVEEPWAHDDSKGDELPLFNPYHNSGSSSKLETTQFPVNDGRYSPLPFSDDYRDDRQRSYSSSSMDTPGPMVVDYPSAPFMREVKLPSTIPLSSSRSPSPKPLAPLIIPTAQVVSPDIYAAVHPVATMETPTSAMSAASSESMYSQASALTARQHQLHRNESPPPPVPPLPLGVTPRPLPVLPKIPDDVIRRVQEAAFEEETDLNRAPTKYIASLVKGRAQRASKNDLSRSGTTVSRIERADSIESANGGGY